MGAYLLKNLMFSLTVMSWLNKQLVRSSTILREHQVFKEKDVKLSHINLIVLVDGRDME
jgi:hypothetical protein